MYITRDSYLEKLKSSLGNGMVKIITGSNSHLLSNDIATEFRDANINRESDNFRLWKEYCLYGGLPQISLLPDEPSKENI